MWIKTWMIWYKYTEHKVQLRSIGERIGFTCADEMKRDGISAFLSWVCRQVSTVCSKP